MTTLIHEEKAHKMHQNIVRTPMGILMPALGESWTHSCPTRIILEQTGLDGERRAKLAKSLHRPKHTADFQITVSMFSVYADYSVILDLKYTSEIHDNIHDFESVVP